eukprot:5226408-Amphidinium_carterae.1
MALTEGEAFDIVLGSASCGAEALRKLIRRFDPSSGDFDTACAKLEGLPLALERWDDLVRRYEKRRAGGDPAQTLDGDIKVAALEALVPVELEQHLAMNRARLPTYDKVRAEVDGYIDAKVSQGAIKGSKHQQGDPMDVDTFVRGNKPPNGPSNGSNSNNRKPQGSAEKPKKDIECWNCGKKGHRSSECWSKPKSGGETAGAKGKSKGGKPKNKGKGKGKDAAVLEEDASAEPASCLDLGAMTSDSGSLDGD